MSHTYKTLKVNITVLHRQMLDVQA